MGLLSACAHEHPHGDHGEHEVPILGAADGGAGVEQAQERASIPEGMASAPGAEGAATKPASAEGPSWAPAPTPRVRPEDTPPGMIAERVEPPRGLEIKSLMASASGFLAASTSPVAEAPAAPPERPKGAPLDAEGDVAVEIIDGPEGGPSRSQEVKQAVGKVSNDVKPTRSRRPAKEAKPAARPAAKPAPTTLASAKPATAKTATAKPTASPERSEARAKVAASAAGPMRLKSISPAQATLKAPQRFDLLIENKDGKGRTCHFQFEDAEGRTVEIKPPLKVTAKQGWYMFRWRIEKVFYPSQFPKAGTVHLGVVCRGKLSDRIPVKLVHP